MKRIAHDHYPLYILFIFIIFFFLFLSLFNRFFFAPKILLLSIIVLIAVYLGKLKILYKDWFVFLSFIYLFDSLRGTIYILTCKFNLPVHTLYVIKIEKFLFGNIPSVSLQQALLDIDNITWLEKFLTVIHGTHFVAFLGIGLIIWLYKSAYFKQFKISFYLVTFIGVSFYFIIPTAPPWLASNIFNVMPELTRFNALIYNMSIPDITAGFSTNPIGAMPSLHSAFPILCSFILWQLYRLKAAPFFLYTFLVLFTIVYTGDHYIVDIIAGGILAALCYFVGFKIKKFSLGSNSHPHVSRHKKKAPILRQYKPLIVGSLILIFGISIGLANKNQFRNHYIDYVHSYAPNYIDFLKNQELYKENYHVQCYLGNHYFYGEQYKKALAFFEHALSLSEDYIDKKGTLMKIKQCESHLNHKKTGP